MTAPLFIAKPISMAKLRADLFRRGPRTIRSRWANSLTVATKKSLQSFIRPLRLLLSYSFLRVMRR